LTAKCWLVIATAKKIHYASLADAYLIYKYIDDGEKDERMFSEDSILSNSAR
jgi:hypothetical protein